MKDEERDGTEINALELLGVDPDIRELASLDSLRTMASFAVQARRMTVEQRAKQLRKLESLEVVTLGEIVDAQQRRAGIELDTEPRDTDKWKPCAGCKRPIGRGTAKRCNNCVRPLCASGCGTRGSYKCVTPKVVASRSGAPWRCRSCATKRTLSSRAPEQRSVIARKAAITSAVNVTSEQRSAARRKGWASKTPEQRGEIAQKAWAARRAKAAPLPSTPEERRERALRSWETRRAREADALAHSSRRNADAGRT